MNETAPEAAALPHAQTRSPGAPRDGFDAGDAADREARSDAGVAFYEAALAAWDSGDSTTAEASYLRSIACFEGSPGSEADLINVRTNYGDLLRALGRWHDALAVYELAMASLASLRASDEVHDEDIARLRMHLLRCRGRVFQEFARFDEAERDFRAALVLNESLFGRDHVELGYDWNALGVVHKYQGRFEEGRACYRRALEILQAHFGDGPELTFIYHNLGGIEHEARRYDCGEPYARRAVELARAAHGPRSVAVASEISAHASLLDGLHRRPEAEAQFREALAIFEEAYGPVHYEVAVNLNNLAAICADDGRFDEAHAHYLRALAIKENLLGSTHPDVAVTLSNLAALERDRRRGDEARRHYERALAIFCDALGAEHPRTQVCRAGYERLLAAQAGGMAEST